MGTKNKPGKFDCYEAAHPDEPMFILLARDPLAPMLVDLWASMRALRSGDSPKVAEAQFCADAMREWKANENPPPSPTPPSEEPRQWEPLCQLCLLPRDWGRMHEVGAWTDSHEFRAPVTSPGPPREEPSK